MKRLTTLAILIASASVAIPSSASAGAAACLPGAANVGVCGALSTCHTVGAAIFNHSAAEAVTFTRNCLFLDLRYTLDNSVGRTQARERSQRLRVAESMWRSLYCEALRRVGGSDTRICRARARSRRGGRGSGGGGSGGGTREPNLTGRVQPAPVP